VRFEWQFPGASVDRILEIWADRAFYDDLSRRLNLSAHEATVARDQALKVDQRLGFSTAKVPAIFRSFLGDPMFVTWTTEWRADGGQADGRIAARNEDGRLQFDAPSRVTAVSDELSWTVDGDPRLNLPLALRVARGQIENELRNIITSVLRNQAELTQAWLADETGRKASGVSG
jgi:hypothetical protein